MKLKPTQKILLYMIGGVIATTIDMGLLFFLTDTLGLYYLLSQTLSFCISLVFGFLFQKHITFQSTTGNNIKQLFLFFLFQIVGLGINLLILKISVDVFHIHYMIGSLLSKGVVFLRNFFMNNFFNFRD